MKLLLLSLFLAASTGARAQSTAEIPAGTGANLALLIGAPAETSTPTVNSPSVSARTLGGAKGSSIAWTVLPVVAGLAVSAAAQEGPLGMGGFLLFTGGLVVGPSAGHFYLGDERRALIGLGIRAGGVGLAALLAHGGESSLSGADEAGKLVVFSGIAIAAGSVYSFSTLDNSAHERGLVLTPLVQADGGAGLALAARF